MMHAEDTELSFIVPAELHAKRLDQVLFTMIKAELESDESTQEGLKEDGFSRTRLQQLIAQGNLSLNGVVCLSASQKVKEGSECSLILPPPIDSIPQGEAMALDIYYEDDHVILINKPAGMVVHPAAGNETGTLVNGLIHHCGDSLSGIGGERRPGIVHRIDKLTSGLLVVAKTQAAHIGLAEQFANHTIKREYLALVWGLMNPPKGRIETRIARDPHDRKKMAVSELASARLAITDYESLDYFYKADLSLISCRLQTGRTHQIRVHLTHKAHPLLGDPVYKQNRRATPKVKDEYGDLESEKNEAMKEAIKLAIQGFDRQALHAVELGFIHPISQEFMEFKAPLPSDMADMLSLLKESK